MSGAGRGCLSCGYTGLVLEDGPGSALIECEACLPEEGELCELGEKLDDSKARWNLIPWGPLAEVVEVLTYGARKYRPDNWQHVPDARARYTAAMMRHVSAWAQGEGEDDESGCSHLAHAVCCGLFLMWFDERGQR